MKRVDCKELALKKVKIEGNVIGKFGTFEIEQIFLNNTNNVLEVGYKFPIVESATVVGFEIEIGDKKLSGVCKEKTEARKEYQENIVKGNSAYLLEEDTDNIFEVAIGKIDKNEEVKVKIKYIDEFELVDDKIKIMIPTLVTPRYKSKITSKLIYGKVDYTVDFKINIDNSIKLKGVESSSHRINMLDEKTIEILNYDLSKDCMIEIELKNELLSNAIISKNKDKNETIYLSFMPEILDTYEDEEKEYLFLIDVSGSMSGQKIEETKRAVIECLKQLDVGDKFNIIAFESDFVSMNLNSIEYNEENLNKAIKYVNSLEARGGTEIFNPIKFALYEEDSNKIILLFTDGQVGNEGEIIAYINQNINRNRIFPFGIDTNVNSHFIKAMAKFGHGKAELIQPKEEIDEKIIRTFARIQTPIVEDLKIDYGKNKLVNEIKEDNALFNYEFFNVFAKVEELKDDIKLKGKILDKEYVWEIKKEDIKRAKVDLELLFAQKEIERLEEYIRNTYNEEKEQIYKGMIVELAEKYNINSKYTSFITVYERENKILEVPKYQETILSSDFMEEERGSCCMMNLDSSFVLRKRTSRSSVDSSDSSIPTFLRKSKKIGANIDFEECFEERIEINKEKTIEELLSEKIREFFDEFINQKDKDILTYILYALFCWEESSSKFDYYKFIEFIKNNKEKIIVNEIYSKLVYLFYFKLKYSNFNREEILEVLDDTYRKIAYTNMKFDVNLDAKKIFNQKISKTEVKDIVENGDVKDRIDELIWYYLEKECWY